MQMEETDEVKAEAGAEDTEKVEAQVQGWCVVNLVNIHRSVLKKQNKTKQNYLLTLEVLLIHMWSYYTVYLLHQL